MNNFMDNFMHWYTRNYVQIAWFIIGWMSMCTLVDFGRGDWSAVALDLLLIFINYLFVRR